MPEISRIPSELAVGKFDDRLMATRLDTLERNNSLFGDFNIPNITYVPKELSTDGIIGSDKMPSIGDYLNSPDPKLRHLGKEYLDNDSRRNIALTKGIGLPDMVRYQPGQEKFTTDHWWSEDGKTKFGYNPDKSLAENENLYYEQVWNNYSLAGKAWRGAGTTALRVLSKLTTGLIGTVGDLGSMAWNGLEELAEAGGGPKNNFWADVSDNVLARAMHNVDNYVKQEIVPTYKSINYDDKGAFSKLTDPYFWQNEIADGAGFLLQFAVPAMLLGKATQAAKAARLAGTSTAMQNVLAAGVGETATAGRFAKATGKALEVLTGSRNVGGITAHVFNTTMESVAETKEGFDATVRDLVRKGYSETEAKEMAAENAPTQFGLNMFILSLSNAFENKWFQQIAGNRAFRREAVNAAGEVVERKAATKLGKFFTDNTTGKRLSFYLPKAGQAMVMEGFWEENAQQAAARVASGGYMRRGDNTISEGVYTKSKSFFKQLAQQTADAMKGNDKEVADSIMAGAVLGVLGGVGFAKLAGDSKKGILPLGERKTRERDKADLVASVKNARAAWMDVSVMPEDLYNQDGTFNQAKVQERVAEINTKLSKIQSMFTRKVEMNDITDPVRRQQLQHTLFADFVRGHIIHGTGESLITKLNNWNTKTSGELAAYGVTEEMIDDPATWGKVAQNLYDAYHHIEGLKFNNPDKLPVESYMKQVAAVRAHIFDYTALKMASETAASQYEQREAEFDPFLQTASVFNSYNATIAKAEWYRQALETPNLNPEVKRQLEEEHTKLTEQIATLKDGLPEHETSNTSDFAFDMGTDVKRREAEILRTLPDYLEFQWLKENAKKESEHYDTIIKEYSNPEKGLPKWNEQVKKWDTVLSRVKMEKLKDFGYTEAEIVNMSPEEQEKLLIEGTKKADNPDVKPVEQEEAPEEEVPESTTSKLVGAMRAIDPKVTVDNLDNAIQKLLEHVQKDPSIELPAELVALIMAYNKEKVEVVKEQATGQFVEEAEQEIPQEEKTEYENKVADIERRREEELDKINRTIEKLKQKEDRRLKTETYRTLDINDNPIEVEISTNADGSRVLRARQINEDGSVEPMAFITERINNKTQATLTNEQLVEVYIGNEGNTLKRTNVDENPDQTYIDKINAKYDAELKALEQQPKSNQFEQDKKADIERRRQELISKYNVEFKEIARKQYDKVSKKYIDGISTQIWSNGKLIAEYESKIEAENELNKKLDALINNIIDSKISLGDNIFIDGITIDGSTFSVLNTSERMITIVDIGGVKVPFYLTTGLGGKNLTPAWYPMFGYSPSGWLNKTDGKDMESFYSRIIGKEASDVLKKVSEKLNNKLGVTPNSIIESGIISKQQTQEAVNSVLNFTPAENQKIDASVDYKVELTKLENNIKSIGEEINAKYDAEIAALETSRGGVQSDIEAKKADIERRREEELNAEQKWWEEQPLEYRKPNENFDKRKPVIDEINARYDAELATAMQLRPIEELRKELDDMIKQRDEWIRIGKNKYDKDAFDALEEQIALWQQTVGEDTRVIVTDLNTPPAPPAPPTPPVDEPGMVPPSLLDEVRHAYRLHQQALENETTFKEEADKESLIIHNNRIDNNSDSGKNEGTINVVTSNPKDIEKGAIRTTDNNIARFNFLDQLSSRHLKREDYKLVLGIGKQGGIYGIVADKDGNFVKFDEVGKPFKEGSNLLFHLDGFDLYSEENIGKRRSAIVNPPFSIAPLTATPISLHPSFVGVDVLQVLKDRIKNGVVTASINFVTQGMLYRQGVNNGFTIPKATATKTAADLFTKGHIKNEKGNIPSESTVIDGIYHRAMRIHFDLLKDINNPSSPTETVEFHPVSIAEAKTEKGEKILDVLKAENGENIIEAAVKGNLPSTAENMLTLQTILRPDKFYVLNLGTVIQVVDLKKFKKFLVSGKVTHSELMKITKLEDVYNSELNISKAYYDSRDSLPLQEGLLSEGSENYSRFINGNVATSAETIKIGGTEGYTRVNKRMTLIVDENMEQLKRQQSQEQQEKKSPTTTVVESEPLTDEDILKEFNNPNPDVDFGDIAQDNCSL